MTLTNVSSWHIAFGHGSVAIRSMILGSPTGSNRPVEFFNHPSSIFHLASYIVAQSSPTDNIRDKNNHE